jgi:hypothetical protein
MRGMGLPMIAHVSQQPINVMAIVAARAVLDERRAAGMIHAAQFCLQLILE